MNSSLVQKAREHGLQRSLRLGLTLLRSRALPRARKHGKQFVFVAPQVDNTGAPQVLLRVIDEFVAAFDPRRIRLITPHVEPAQVRHLGRANVRVERSVSAMGPRLVKLQLGLQVDDFVLINSAAVAESYQRHIVRALQTGALTHASWLIHEDTAQLPIVAPHFLTPGFRRELAHLLESERLSLFVPSLKVKNAYDELLETGKVKIIRLRIDLPEKHCGRRPVGDFSRVDFLLSGTPTDGRKGQMLALFALQHFLRHDCARRPSDYRDFSLTVLGLDDSYLSLHIRFVGESLLGDRLRLYPNVPHDKALEIAHGCNAVLCCSLNEAFPLYVAEGMAMGHVLLRNDVGGVDEQLADGVNGFLVDATDMAQFSGVIERVLNKSKTSDEQLQAMGRASQELIAPYRRVAYRPALEDMPPPAAARV